MVIYYGKKETMEKEIMQGIILLVKEEEEDQEHVGRIT